MARQPTLVSRSLERARVLRAQFDAVHAQGLAALQRRDYAALDRAIQRERDIITEQVALIDEELVVHAVQHELFVMDRVRRSGD